MRLDKKTNSTAGEAPAKKQKADEAPDKAPSLEFRGSQDTIDALTALLEKREIPGADGTPTTVLWVSGAPRSGKTLFAKKALVEAERITGDKARMVVLNARESDRLTSDVMPHIQTHAASKHLITTVTSLAYEVIAESRRRRRKPLPHSLDGVEQDNLIAHMLGEHTKHADGTVTAAETPKDGGDSGMRRRRRGSTKCKNGLCKALYRYFIGTGGARAGEEPSDVFKRNFSQGFITTVRAAFARMDELGIRCDEEPEREIVERLHSSGADGPRPDEGNEERLHLLFMLRREYDEYCAKKSSFMVNVAGLPMQAARELEDNPEMCKKAIPEVLIVDDAQELTIAGMAFIQALNRQGVPTHPGRRMR